MTTTHTQRPAPVQVSTPPSKEETTLRGGNTPAGEQATSGLNPRVESKNPEVKFTAEEAAQTATLKLLSNLDKASGHLGAPDGFGDFNSEGRLTAKSVESQFYVLPRLGGRDQLEFLPYTKETPTLSGTHENNQLTRGGVEIEIPASVANTIERAQEMGKETRKRTKLLDKLQKNHDTNFPKAGGAEDLVGLGPCTITTDYEVVNDYSKGEPVEIETNMPKIPRKKEKKPGEVIRYIRKGNRRFKVTESKKVKAIIPEGTLQVMIEKGLVSLRPHVTVTETEVPIHDVHVHQPRIAKPEPLNLQCSSCKDKSNQEDFAGKPVTATSDYTVANRFGGHGAHIGDNGLINSDPLAFLGIVQPPLPADRLSLKHGDLFEDKGYHIPDFNEDTKAATTEKRPSVDLANLENAGEDQAIKVTINSKEAKEEPSLSVEKSSTQQVDAELERRATSKSVGAAI